MLKKIAFICLVFISLKQFAQVDINPIGFTVGPMAGITSTTASVNINKSKETAGSGISLGGFARLRVLRFLLQPELLYTTRSSSFVTTEAGIPGNNVYPFNVTTKGIDINILGGYRLLSLGQFAALRAMGGVGLGYVSDKTLEYNGVSYVSAGIKDQAQRLILGVGIDALKLTADLRFEIGLTNVMNNTTVDLTHNTFSLTLGFMLFQ